MDLSPDTLKDQLLTFMSGSSFLVATGIFFAYLFVTGVFKRIFGFFGTLTHAVLGIFSPLKMRRIFFNFIALVFMVTSFSLYSGTRAKLAGEDGTLQAVLGGSLALGIWSVLMFMAHLVREHHHAARRGVPQKKVKRPTIATRRH